MGCALTPPDFSWIGPEYRDQAHTQSYAPRPRIDGVTVTDLPVFSDEGGDFCEITRFNPDGALALAPDYRPAQISYSLMAPGQIKAFHLHRHQDDLWFVPPAHRLLVGLLDVREVSPTYRIHMRLVLGAGKGRLLHIPRGVAHGIANLNTAHASIIYFTNTAFNPDEPDEHRLPHDLLGSDFWTIRAG
jgi:dTDP-4-dehydrorhamnose 3,5-epimerase